MIPEKYYQTRLEETLLREKLLIRLINRLSLLRLLMMILFIFLLIKGIKNNDYYLLILSAIALILFFYLVSLHKRKTDQRKKNRAIIEINEKEIKAFKGDYSSFFDGSEYLDPEHEFTYDLDIFGPKSIFQFICRSCTFGGRSVLASKLLNSPHEEKDIYRYQKIHQELSEKIDFIQDYLSTGDIIEVKKGEEDQLRSWLNHDGRILPLFSHYVALLFMLLNVGLVVLSFIIPGILGYLITSIILSWLFYGIFFNPIHRYHSHIGKRQEIIRKYNNLSIVLGKQKFENDELNNFRQLAQMSVTKVRKLEIWVDLFDTRLNLFAGVILNTLFLLDFHMILILEDWKKQNRSILNRVFQIHSETDAYISGSVFLFNHPDYIFPEIVNEGFSASKIGHPLIKVEECVVNDFHFNSNENIIIITGANMAGKSTFLRAVGVNLILAGCGFPVMAEKLKFECNPVITGMRTTDSLTESESYFFAELKRLKRIMDRLRSKEKLYVFLDEILKGTNSVDKHKGSEELLKQIANYNGKIFIATHDLELGKMEEIYPEKIRNYHFESFIKNEDLIFDYKVRKGIAVNMNASFLLKKMNILKN